MLSKQGFQHHLSNIEHHAKWVEYYKDMPELAEQAQGIVDTSKQVLLSYFEEIEENQPKTIQQAVDFPALIIEWKGNLYRRT